MAKEQYSPNIQKEEQAAKEEGWWKIGLSAASFVAWPVAGICVAVGGASFVFSAATKVGALILPENYGGKKCQQWSQESRSFGVKAVVAGVASPIIWIEGLANLATGKRSYGIAPMARYLARKISGGIPQTDGERLFLEEEEKRRQAALEVQNMPAKQQQQSQQPHQPSIANIDVAQIRACPTFQEAQQKYVEHINKVPDEQKFIPNEPIRNSDGTTTIVYDDPNPAHKGKAEYQVTYVLAADKKPISITGGEKASCMLPPIEKSGNKFEMVGLKNGQLDGAASSDIVKVKVPTPLKSLTPQQALQDHHPAVSLSNVTAQVVPNAKSASQRTGPQQTR